MSTPIQGLAPLTGQTHPSWHSMLGNASSHYGAGIFWRRLSLNSPQLLPYRSFDSAVYLTIQPGRPLWMANTSPSPMETRVYPVTPFLVHDSISRPSKLP